MMGKCYNWDENTYFNDKVQPKDGHKYQVCLKDGSTCDATFDDYTESLDRPDFWVIHPKIKVGNKERTIRHVIRHEVTHWYDNP